MPYTLRHFSKGPHTPDSSHRSVQRQDHPDIRIDPALRHHLSHVPHGPLTAHAFLYDLNLSILSKDDDRLQLQLRPDTRHCRRKRPPRARYSSVSRQAISRTLPRSCSSLRAISSALHPLIPHAARCNHKRFPQRMPLHVMLLNHMLDAIVVHDLFASIALIRPKL